MSFYSLAAFALKLGAIEADLKLAGSGIIAEWCWAVRENARSALGTYRYGWEPLAASTLARKSEDTPLLETGQLRDSIGIKLSHDRGEVGTNDPYAEFHEHGSSHEPPRSFMLNAALEATGQIHKWADHYIGAAIAGRGMHATNLATILHRVRIILEIAREVKRVINRISK
jgi:phage gpG-like protein